MKGRLDFMTQQHQHPCEECTRKVLDRCLPEKEYVEELYALSPDKHRVTFAFNGSYHMASSTLFVGDKEVARHLCMYGNYNTALSQTNKRHLNSLEVYTDYITPNPMLARALGFTAEEAQVMVYSLNTDELPVRLRVTGYDKATGEKFETAKVAALFFSGSEEEITDEEATSLIADFLLDNDFVLTAPELITEFSTLEKANEVVLLSDASKAFGENASEDEWEQLEYALAYEMAAEYLKNMAFIALQAYGFIHDRYDTCDFILAETAFTFGFGTEDALCITGEVATMNNSFIVNKADFVETKQFVQPHLVALEEYYAAHGTDAEVPEEVLDEIADTCFYIAESLCGDLEFELHMKEIISCGEIPEEDAQE